jgi:DGQHR domain-containing protein
MADHRLPFFRVQQWDKQLFLTRMTAGLLTKIAYASIRGVDSEPGAVQRYLNTRRISNIREFTLGRGDYPNAVVLNWVNRREPLRTEDEDTLIVSDAERSAQLIDGQHRVAGLKAAIEEDPSVSDLEIPVAIYEHLETTECANIFLSINTEQKPVPRSLVFDLYGIADEQIVDPAASRARDIATSLNEDPDSPYRGLIKLPGAPRRKGGIALSTAVSAIKPLVEEKGDLEQIGVSELERQKRIVINFFGALADLYGNDWNEKSNAFMYASGFVGAIDFLRYKLVPYCNSKHSFRKEVIAGALEVSAGSGDLIIQDEVKGKGGKDAPKIIYDRLVGWFNPQEQKTQQIEV